MTTTYYISNQASNGFAVGDDANDGLSMSTPFLTANAIFAAASVKDDVQLIFNDGEYYYTDNGGQYQLNNPLIEIIPYNDWKTTLYMSGSATDGAFARKSTGLSDSLVHIGRFYIGPDNNTQTSTEYILFNIASGVVSGKTQTIRMGARLMPIEGVVTTFQYLYYSWLNNTTYEVYDGGLCGPDGEFIATTTCDFMVANRNNYSVTTDTFIWIKRFFFNAAFTLSGTNWLTHFTAYNGATGWCRVEGFTGYLEINGSSPVVHLASFSSAPHHSRITNWHDFELNMTSSSMELHMVNVWSNDVESNHLRICDFSNVKVSINDGELILLGRLSNSSILNDCQVYNIDIENTMPSPVYADVIGISAYRVTTTSAPCMIFNNHIEGTYYGITSEDSIVQIFGNTVQDPYISGYYNFGNTQDGDFVCRDNRMIVTDGSKAHAERAANPEGYSLFENTTVLMPAGGYLDAQLFYETNSGIGESKGMRIGSTLTPKYYGRNDQVNYASLSGWLADEMDPRLQVLPAQMVTITAAGAEDLTGITLSLYDAYFNRVLRLKNMTMDSSGQLTIDVAGLGLLSGDVAYYKLDDFADGAVELNGAHGSFLVP